MLPQMLPQDIPQLHSSKKRHHVIAKPSASVHVINRILIIPFCCRSYMINRHMYMFSSF